MLPESFTIQSQPTLIIPDNLGIITLYWTQMADDSNGQRLTFEASNVTWSLKFTLIFTLNPELMCRAIVTDAQL